jgi:hypothetical protein
VRLKENLKQKTLKFNLGGRWEALSKRSIYMINWVFTLFSNFLNAFTTATYIFIAPTCTTTIITLEPYALNVEFQHFIPIFNKISSFCGYSETGVWGWKEAIRQGDFLNNLHIYTYMSPNIYALPCKCIWQIFTAASCKCKCKKWTTFTLTTIV